MARQAKVVLEVKDDVCSPEWVKTVNAACAQMSDRATPRWISSMVDHARLANAFFGYFPTWQMFSHDIRTHRDEMSKEEAWVRTALGYLADLVGRTHTDLLGQYFGAQTGGQASEAFANDLLGRYDAAFQKSFGRPSGAFPVQAAGR